MIARKSEQFPISFKVEGDSGSLYVQAKIYDDANTLIDTVNLSHVSGGNYVGNYTYSGAEYHLYVDFLGFTDAGYSVEDTDHFYPTDDIYIDVPADFKADVSGLSTLTAAQVNTECDTAISDAGLATNTDMKRALGLMQENISIDNPTFDSNNNLLTARFRIYSDSASVGTDDDVLATYNMTATFSGAGKVTTYKMVQAA
jgi:hypothetical protein